MEGQNISEISYSGLGPTSRIDSHFYRKDLLELEVRFKEQGWPTLAEVCSLIPGPFGSEFLVENYSMDQRFRYVRGKDVKPFFLTEADNVYLPESDFARLANYSLSEGDILLSVVGTLGNAAIVTPDNLPAIYSCKSTLVRSNEVDPWFLIAYLNSDIGQPLLLRNARGTVQTGLNLPDIRELVVPVLSDSLVDLISSHVRTAYDNLAASSRLLMAADRLLENSLGFDTWQAPEPLTYTRRAADVFAAGRMDAEHYQERYYALDKLLRSYPLGTVLLGDICPAPVNGVEIREYYETGIPYLRVGDLKFYDLHLDSVVRVNAIEAKPLISKVALRVGDVLVSRSGSLGVTGVVKEEWADALISSHLIRLRIKNPEIDPYYLAVFLATYPGRSQIDQKSNGGVQPEINQPSLKSIVVPKLDREVQRMIRKSVEESHNERNQAMALLDRAKRAVEIAIEESEAAALAYLDELAF